MRKLVAIVEDKQLNPRLKKTTIADDGPRTRTPVLKIKGSECSAFTDRSVKDADETFASVRIPLDTTQRELHLKTALPGQDP